MSKHISNKPHYQQAKVIEIKPIQMQQENSGNFTQSEGDNKNTLTDNIQKYKEEIIILKKQKETLIQETKEKISIEKERWNDEKNILIKEAHHEGYQDGFNSGKQEGLDKYDSLIQEANNLIQQATKDYFETIEKSQEMIIQLAIHTAEKILNQKISEEPERFLPIVQSAIQEIKDQPTVSIYVHPNNYETVLQHKTGLLELLNGDTKLSIFIDQSLNENGCLIEHPFGQIDASIDTQLKQIHKALQQYLTEKNKQ